MDTDLHEAFDHKIFVALGPLKVVVLNGANEAFLGFASLLCLFGASFFAHRGGHFDLGKVSEAPSAEGVAAWSAHGRLEVVIAYLSAKRSGIRVRREQELSAFQFPEPARFLGLSTALHTTKRT